MADKEKEEESEGSDDEEKDPTYDTESEDEYSELDIPYEFDDWYVNNVINA